VGIANLTRVDAQTVAELCRRYNVRRLAARAGGQEEASEVPKGDITDSGLLLTLLDVETKQTLLRPPRLGAA
jgi:hypothetical protein